ncbi:MAG: bifunctional hydroxymethylpyrimidine kinase/phosphomethylpyrimidine kinase [Candidatus Kryptoniota bacterium]
MKYILIIAASDSSGGAGIQNDVRVVSDWGCWPVTAVTGITVQNFNKVFKIKPLAPKILMQQIQVCLNSFDVKAIKIGALCSQENLIAVISSLKKIDKIPIVFDPVLISSSGKNFLPSKSLNIIKKQLLPLSTVVTPNKIELELLQKSKLNNIEEGINAAIGLSKQYHTSVFLKGGHFDSDVVNEALIVNDVVYKYLHARYHFSYSHGTGCTFSTTLACLLANGKTLQEACPHASEYVAKRYHEISIELNS